MRNKILRVTGILAITVTLFYSGCSDNGADSGVTNGGNVDALIKRTRGTNDPKVPVLCTLKVVIDPANGGTVSKSPDKEQYSEGDAVQINAAPEPGYRFTGWSGASTGTANPLTLQMNGNKELIANFLPENVTTYSLNVNANPIIGGTVTKSPDKPEYASGETVYLTAAPEAGYAFTGWSGASASKDAAVTITVDGNKELIANFARQTYTLTVNANPANGGSISKSPGQTAYFYEEEVTVTASENPGYKFTGWSGALSSTSASVTIKMDDNKSLTARFEWQGTTPPPDDANPTYTLITTTSPANSGTVSSNPDKTRYNADEAVYVTAEAAEGYRFVGWSGASGAQSAGVTITMNGDKELIAIFEILTYTLTVDRNLTAGGTVSRTPDRTNYNHGTSVTVSASANSGYRFTGWTGASTSSEANVAVTMDGNKTMTANFEQIPTYTVTFNANGGSGTVSSLNARDGNSVTLPSGNGFSRSGYTFGGWNTNNSGTGTNYSAGSSYTPTGNITLYAKWDAIPRYTITFDANGGTVTTTSATTGTDGRLSSSLPTPTRSGYTFSGWYTATTGGTQVTTSTVFSANATIYAQWTLNTYTITFNANGGTVTTTSGTTGTGGTLSSLPTPTRSGYRFDGWYTGMTVGTQVTTSTTFSANTTIYAQWTLLVTYTITFNANGGTVTPETASTGEGRKLASLPTPTLEGYFFVGWFTAATGGTGVDESKVYDANAIIYAQWRFAFVDSRDNKIYNKTKIGNQVWMAENLNYNASGSACYNNSADSCGKYGRLYNWETAKTACPVDWHLPSDAEWTALENAAGGSSVGKKLKSTSGWNFGGNGTDELGFSALPGGSRGAGSFSDAGIFGNWWSATENYTGSAWYRIMSTSEHLSRSPETKTNLYSVRCVAD